MSNEIAVAQDELIADFELFEDWMDRYQYLIDLGRRLPEFPDELRTEENRIRGCQSQVWLAAELDGPTVRFFADSDAAITRGLISLLLSVFSGHSPAEIIEAPTDFIDNIGLAENLTLQRRNGLAAMIKQIKFYAIGLKVLAERT